jgi:YggT family protein
MNPFLWLFNTAIDLIVWVVIAGAIASWLVAFGVVNTRNNAVRMIIETLFRLTDPLLRPLRRILPDLGGVDISPVVLLVLLYFIRYFVNYYFFFL